MFCNLWNDILWNFYHSSSRRASRCHHHLLHHHLPSSPPACGPLFFALGCSFAFSNRSAGVNNSTSPNKTSEESKEQKTGNTVTRQATMLAGVLLGRWRSGRFLQGLLGPGSELCGLEHLPVSARRKANERKEEEGRRVQTAKIELSRW